MSKAVCGIYAITFDDKVMYIGQAKDIHKRFKQHCSVAQNRGNTLKNAWLTQQLKDNILPVLKTVEETDNLDEREIYWIDSYRTQGQAELNMHDGGKIFTFSKRNVNTKPWGKGWSPIQRRLIAIKQDIKALRKLDKQDRADKLEARLDLINEKIKRNGLDYMNMALWEKYGN